MPAPISAKSERTRLRIRAAAAALFNERGVAAVNTHAIARAARLSPGNLYYHYPDKRAIVREIFSDIAIYKPERWEQPDGFGPFLEFYLGSVVEHRFFFRDFSGLLREDRVLAARWRRAWADVSQSMRATLRRWVAEGLMNPFRSAADEDAFLDNAWVLSHFAGVYAEAKRPAGDSDARLQPLIGFLRPYHTPKGLRELERFAARLS